ncbi:HYR domain-containing protein [Christiangramia sediminis]|uniref:HYR domain-containing protein n=1 Tax=Christiangramia sediminis TaxID=2881336 RepID=A0A9X1LHI0_9FLAO|nr:HYR domain-containing protein [Christiangramia sediminis]MCB7480451.1 HYR domain-containing protein [Christiangramia sediminis]
MIWKTTLPHFSEQKNKAKAKSLYTPFKLMFAVILTLSLNSFQVSAQSVIDVVNPNGGFSIEGDLKANIPVSNVGDWFPGGTGTGGYVFNNNGTPVDPNFSKFVSDIPTAGNNDRFLTGSKADQDPDIWKWSDNNSGAQNKGDLLHAFYHISRDETSGDQWIFVGADRVGNNGTSYIDFTFLQNEIIESDDKSVSFISTGPDAGRTVNDILLTIEYTNGGSNPKFYVYQWKEVSPNVFQYVEIINYTQATTEAYARVNTSENIDSPAGAFGYSSIAQYKFVEGAINLSAILDNLDVCNNDSIGIESIFVKTKNSDSPSADLEDYISPISVDFTIASATISYLNSPVCSDSENIQVTLEGKTGGKFSSTTGLSIDENTGEINVSLSTPGTYTVTYNYTSYTCNKQTTTSVTIIPKPDAPEFSVTQPVCGDTNGVVTISNYDNSLTYTLKNTEDDSEQQLTNASNDVAPGTYVLTVSSNNCNATAASNVVINNAPVMPDAPTGDATQNFCAIDSPTVADLLATGSNIKWYATIDSDNALNDTDTLVNGEDYFATQTGTDCESDTRLKVTVTVDDPAAPTGEATQDFCAIDTPTVADLSAAGTNIKWYAEQGDENALEATTALMANEDYFATQTIDGCESDEYLQVTADIADPAAPTGEATQDFCAIDTPTVDDLSATGTNIKWYAEQGDENALEATTALMDNEDYFATQTIDGCESDEYLQVTVDIADPAAPTGEATQDFCAIDTPTVADLSATGTNIKWYAEQGDENALEATTALMDNEDYFATQTIDGCESDEYLQVTVDIADPAAPTGEATQDFCAIDTPTVADLSATGTNIKWYAEQGDENALEATTALIDNEDYFATQTIDGCESDEYLQVTVDIADPAAPTGEATQDFCAIDTPTIADLSATGTNIKWYAEQGDENALEATTALMDNEDYFATQTIDGCESDEYLQVTVDIADPAAPTGEATQDFCAIDTPTVADLSATGTNIKWYAEQGDENALEATTALMDNEDYFATQTIDGCESDEYLQVTVDIADPAAPTGEATQDFCAIDTPTVADLSATGTNIKWYAEQGDENALEATTALMDNEDYFATQTIDGCESDEYLQVTVEIADPAAPTGEATQDFCAIDTPTVADLSATGTNIKWYAEQGDENALEATTALMDNEDYFATQTIDGCESDEYLQVTVEIADPAAPTGEATQDFCAIDTPTVADLSATGTNIKWYAEQGDENALEATTALMDNEDYFATQTIDGCESDEYLQVTVEIADPAAPTGETVQTFCFDSGATVADLSPNGNNIIWYANDATDTPLLSTETLLNEEDYYASQIVNGCESDERLMVVVEILPEITLSAETTSVTCNGEADGEITVTSDTNVTFEIFQGTENVTSQNGSLSAGFYTIVGSLASTQTDIVCTNEIVVEIKVLDNIDPEITVPESLTLEVCTPEEITADNARFPLDTDGSDDIKENFEASGYSASDDQELVSLTYTDDIQDNGNCFPVIIRTFYATDNCGGQSSDSITIKLEDNTNPTFNETLPSASLTVECDNIPDALELTAIDNCSGEIEVLYTETFEGKDDDCANEYTIIRTWSAEDCSGNDISFTQTITVEDTVAPEFDQETLPTAEITAECDNIPAAATLTATDSCAGVLEVTYTEEFNGQDDECANEYTIIRTWFAEDCAGNELEYVQTITVEDTIAPEFDQETLPKAEITIECDNIPAAATLTATDSCAGVLEVTYTEEFNGQDDECTNEYTIIRTWFTEDCAGNELEYVQTITVEDTVAPEFDQETLPTAEITVECDNIPAAATLTATDNCAGDLEVTYTEEITGQDDECANEYTIIRTWFAEDCAGNELEYVQTITVEDTVAPEFNEAIPADMSMECENLPEIPTITATDNCAENVEVEFSEISTKENETDKEYTVTRTWSASDCAGNEISGSQVITIQNTGAPSFNENLPADLTVECDAVPTAPVITATDGCVGDIEVNYTETFSGLDDECANEYMITRIWTATDDAENEVSHTQTITVVDTTAPEFDQELPESNLTVECDAVPVVVTLTASDNCSGTVEVSFEELISDKDSDDDNNYTITRSYMAADCAGNEVSFTQIITVEDTTAPVITTCPEAVTISSDDGLCSASNVELGMPTATDNCDSDLTITNDAPEVFPIGETTVNWTVTDKAGNIASCSQIVNVVDDENPVVEAIDDININSDPEVCGAIVNFETIIATDNCEIDTIEVTEGLSSGSEFPVGTTTVSITVTDVSGNTTTTSFDVNVTDNEAPEISCPSNMTVDTETGVSYATVDFDNATATDNCKVTVEQTAGPVSGSQFEIGTTTITFTATDDAGNTSECSFTITVEDNEDPTITCPADIDLTNDAGVCGAVVEFTIPEFSDNSGFATIEQTAGLEPGEVFPVGITTVSYTVTDEAGNSASCSFDVTVTDNEAPVLEEMNDITMNNDNGVCGAVIEFASVAATDNCEIESVVITEGFESGSEFPVGTTTVTYTVTDINGNVSTESFTVTVNDNEDPVISCPVSMTVSTETGVSYATVDFDNATATDNCEVSVEQTGGPVSGSQFEIGTTTVTFTATDAAGNTTECSFTVTVEDNEDPTISCPSDISQNVDAGICGAAVTFETPEGLDNSGNVTIEQTAGLGSGEVFPVGTTTVTFTATDAAGNSVDCSFTVTVADDEAPEIEDMDNITLNTEDGICGAVANFNTPGATDNCEIENVELTEGLEPGSVFPVGTTTVTYTATDNNGNTATSSFTVTVNDNEAPAIECPESITVNVDNGVTGVVVNYDAVTTTDNCEGTTIKLTSGIASGEEFPVGETTVTYTVTDASGNSTTCSFTVIVNENNPAPPAGPTVEITPATCSNPTGTITVVDAQDGLSYSIDGENYQTEGVFADLAPGTYDVVAQDEFGQLSELTTVVIEDPVAEEIELVNNGVVDLCVDDSAYDLSELFVGDFDESGVWVDVNNTGALSNGFVDPDLLALGSYTFEYQVDGNCPSTTTVSVLINDDCVVLDCSIEDIKNGISKAVTPNGDNKNDVFKVDLDLACGFTYNVKIFNRWGAKVFDAQNYQNNWDGYSDSSFSSSNQLPSGTYFYILEIREGNFEPIQGYIYLGTK